MKIKYVFELIQDCIRMEKTLNAFIVKTALATDSETEKNKQVLQRGYDAAVMKLGNYVYRNRIEIAEVLKRYEEVY